MWSNCICVLFVKGKICPQSKSGKPKGPQPDTYLWFLNSEATTSISTPPGWDTSPSQVTSQHFVRLSSKQFAGFPFIHLGGERHCESQVFCLRTQCGCTDQGANSRPSGPKSDALTTGPPPRLPRPSFSINL